MNICLYGASSDAIKQEYLDSAYALGQEMARRSCRLIFGGGAHGIMGAIARGVRDGGGELLGVAPKFFDKDDILFPDCTDFIYTDTMRERKQIMEERSDAFIMAPGGIGTYEEFFEILTLKQLSRHKKAIVIYNTDGYYNKFLEMLEYTSQEGFMRYGCLELYKVFSAPGILLDYLQSYNPAMQNITGLKYGLGHTEF